MSRRHARGLAAQAPEPSRGDPASKLTNAVASAGARVGRASLRVGRVVGKLVLFVAVTQAVCGAGAWGIRHVVDSPRFQIRAIEFSPTPHLGQAEVLGLAAVAPGDKLLGVDTDAVAARIATHPWVASVRASRRLPSSLVIEVTERHAVAVAALSGLYLIDESGRPFKRATMDEADGLPVLTGIDRGRYAQMRDVSEAAFREALAVLRQYRERPSRPPVGEISIDPGFGFRSCFSKAAPRSGWAREITAKNWRNSIRSSKLSWRRRWGDFPI
jgi:cell division protein FtsQ